MVILIRSKYSEKKRDTRLREPKMAHIDHHLLKFTIELTYIRETRLH